MCFRMKPWMPMITIIGKIKTSMSTIMTDFFRQSFQNYFHYCITIIGYYTRRWSETGPEYLEAIYYWLKASINQDRGKRERERERDLSTSKWYIWERLENVILFGFNSIYCNKMDWNVCVLILNIFLKRQIDDNQEKYVKRLADTVAIKSVSAWPETRPDITTMIEWTKVVSSYFVGSFWFMNN